MAEKRSPEGKRAKIASRVRETQKESLRHRYSTRPEDIVARYEGGLIIAKDQEGHYYKTHLRYTSLPLADPNRYGRPSARLSLEEVTTLLQSIAEK